MTVRISEHAQHRAAVEHWQRHGIELADAPGRLPEPTQLYSVAALEFVRHAPRPPSDCCQDCGSAWPCESVRLAYRLREGF